MITLCGVSKNYSSEVNIGPVTLNRPAGGITALVMSNGPGKFTLLTMAARLIDIDESQIPVDELDVSSTQCADLAKVLSILRQENHFITRPSMRQLVGFGRFPHVHGRLIAKDEEIISTSFRVDNASVHTWR
ncbi:Iron(3+)-hydroxamate import ATP-binding protein FhuC [Corynebacterium felinum]|uniref:ABC-type enterochelin transport system ATPase subunit n=1 Tax=Corynebacterium felinum TaxID=131318 RepID=A0ABU2BB67_9CORY|nr:ABC-type enterochelin transport system ATPase subunit [Corynebacterium felinum]WJY94344.1 Iron(3+)-hydroxamate import ATP-binding protein FhuC [Corynebacterium felinum]